MHEYNSWRHKHVELDIGGNNIRRIARKLKKIAIGG